MAPRSGCAPHPGRKMSPLCSTSGGSETLLRIRSLAGSIIDTLESSLQNGRLHGPRGFPFGRLSWWPRLVGDRYVISSAGVTPNEVSGKIHKDTGANPTLGRLNCFEAHADPPKMPYVLLIEFRPNDLALPRIARLTDDILPKSRMSRLR
jgi:hypothetical protein